MMACQSCMDMEGIRSTKWIIEVSVYNKDTNFTKKHPIHCRNGLYTGMKTEQEACMWYFTSPSGALNSLQLSA